MYTEELYHHGVLGMKWGVRRYQNYDGSYTRAGMKRYNESLAKYEKADKRYKEAKKNYKIAKKNNKLSNGELTELTNSRLRRTEAKKKLNKDYDHLKYDKLGDKGKILYSKGKRITENETVTNTLAQIGGLAVSAAIYNKNTGMVTKYVNKALGNVGGNTINKALIGIGTAATVAATAKKAKDYDEARKLRAYYGHTSNY